MSRIIERTEASGVGTDDYVLLCSPTLGERKFKAIDLVPSGGNTPIVYHYSNDRKICVGENTIDGTCTWYFMGYYLAENDTAPPSELLAYIPADTGVLQSENYVSDQDLTQNGWCGFYNGNLRLWTVDTSSLQTGYLWGVVNTFEKTGTVYYPQHNGYFEPDYIPKETKLGNWFTLAKDSSTDAKDNLNVNQYNITWNGGVSISSGLLGNFDVSNYSKVKVKLTTGTSYYNTMGTHEIRKIWCGLTPQKHESMFTPSDVTWNSVEKYFTDNSEIIIELTPTTGVNNYINITTFGWNVDIEISLFE